ncbi:MAG: VacJ family lipoprotein [Methylococcales bacterium]
MQKKKLKTHFCCLALFAVLTGCATTGKDDRDPLEAWNRGVQTFNDRLDQYAIKPVAQGYNWIMPNFADQAVSNFFSNINDIGVTINDLLQFKISQTGLDGSRFIVNTVAGVGGLVDVAAMIDLPKHKEDFDQTLAVWGVPSGPYIVLPLLGPSSTRGIGGLVGDAAMNPITYTGFGVCPGISSGSVGTAISGGLFALKIIDFRSDNLSTGKIADEAATDRYEFYKNAYFQQRKHLINDGHSSEGDEALDVDKELDGILKPY